MKSFTIAIVGAGPRGTGVLERLLARRSDAELHIHVVDPFPPGAGRIWRSSQPPLLWMNSVAADVTMFTDDTTVVDGPIRPGPTLAQWVLEHADTLRQDPELRDELRDFGPHSFASRTLQSRYLSWVFEHAVADTDTHVHVHRARVTDLTADQVLLLDDGSTIRADAVLLAQGHPDALASQRESQLDEFSRTHGLTYIGPGYTADLDPSRVPAGKPVLIAGLGLAFIDWMVLLAETRGGSFARNADGVLEYTASGREPILYAGSRRGVPYHAKISYDIAAARPPLPKFFTADAFPGHGPLHFRDEIWPLASKELAWAHYYELFAAHPERTVGSWPEFEIGFSEIIWNSAELTVFVEQFVPKDEDRIDLARLDKPFAGRRFDGLDEVRTELQTYIETDLRRRADPYYSSDAAVFSALLSVYMTIGELLRRGRIPAQSVAGDVEGWLHSFFSFVASGPPPERLEQLLALSRANIVHFLGPDVTFSTESGSFVARSSAHDVVVHADTLIDARLPVATIAAAGDELLRALHTRGDITDIRATEHSAAKVAVDGRSRLITASGEAAENRYAVGPWVAGHTWSSAFPRPRTNAGFFRHNDQLAAELLRHSR
ncbi:FAD/NAD(P)-binding protein [Rhodococcus fascians]|nr:FAD/NAD(P)-binding protein [Rhodococcus fascians]MBY4236887.1 FAD/NAD(P)-binding protein [Rhodococcus fascians]MBY4252867.1 FAD/NAD(P)-binding protein [Rhodococcus fascians]MBY4268203.1 FAD/NAD(P)-binding protein [Rhodococcus fascians]